MATQDEPQESVFQEADRLTKVDRREKYGHALDDYTKVTGMFSALIAHKLKEPLAAEEGVMFMQCVKMAREEHCHQRDNIVDLIGYTGLLKEIKDERERRAKPAQDPDFYHYSK